MTTTYSSRRKKKESNLIGEELREYLKKTNGFRNLFRLGYDIAEICTTVGAQERADVYRERGDSAVVRDYIGPDFKMDPLRKYIFVITHKKSLSDKIS